MESNSYSLFLIEEDGKVGAQVHGDREKLKSSYDNLKRSPSRRVEARVSLVNLSWDEDNNLSVTAESKVVPPAEPIDENGPDGMILGKGPYYLPKEEEDSPESI